MQSLATILLLLMGLTFPNAPRVEAGDKPTAAQWNGMALSANTKKRSGLGDFHDRDCYYALNWARQIRMPDEFGSFPPQGEYWEINALLDTRLPADPPWTPVAGPGEPEGTNTSSLPGAFVFGIEAIGFESEEDRIGFPNFDLWGGSRPPETLEEWWELAKIQSGAIDPDTNGQRSPATEAARSAQVFFTTRVPHGMLWGGEHPMPIQLLANCGELEGDGFGIPSYAIKFTALVDDVTVPSNHGTVSVVGGRSVVTYAGSCPYWTAEVADGHVQGISKGSGYYIVFVYAGGSQTFDIFPTSEWFQGPYTGEGQLNRRSADHFDDAVYEFCVSFRGTESQRNPDTFDIKKVAFWFKEFQDGQYFLAPNIGREFAGDIAPEYPRATAKGASIASGTKLRFGSRDRRDYRAGFVMAGCFAKAENLSSTVTLEVLSGETVLARLTLTPDEPMALKTFPSARTPAPLSVRLANRAKFDGEGEIIFEANEKLAYTPDHWDAYLLLRSGATLGGDALEGSFVDGSGFDYTTAPALYQNYKTYGCIVNTTAAGIRSQDAAINPNPIYEAMRRRLMTMFRMFHRKDCLSYTIENGLPVLRFKRFPYGLSRSVKADNWAGIAPDWRGVSEVVEDVVYVVRSHTGGTIKYNGKKYAHEQRFIGRTESEFEAKGDAVLLEYEGIQADAPRKGYSNEWLMSEEFHAEHPSPTSIWNSDVSADYFVRGNRCGFYSTGLLSDRFPGELSKLADIGPEYDTSLRQLHLSPEIPSGYTYYGSGTGALNSSADSDFCASCQVYKAPYEFASVTVEFVESGDDVIKAVFKAPFQTHPDAPASFDDNPLNWSDADITALRAESYRTTDNGLREYMLYKAKGIHSSYKKGDSAFVSSVSTIPDNPLGYVFPRFFASSLVKKVYADGNNTWDAHDTRMAVDEMIKLRIRLKAWCEGAVDGFSTETHLCDDGGTLPYDFTFENLCFKAFGGADIVRPQVCTDLRADTFNQLAACLDELYMFNLRRVCTFQATDSAYFSQSTVKPTWGDGVCTPPEGGPGAAAYWAGTPPSPSFDSSGTAVTLIAYCEAGLTLCGPGGTTSQELGMTVIKHDISFRYIVTPGFENAIPAYLQNLIDDDNIAAVGQLTRYSSAPHKFDATDISQTACTEVGDGPGAFGPLNAYFKVVTTDPVTTCAIVQAQTLSAGNPQGGDYSICSYADAGNPAGFSTAGAGSYSEVSFTKLSDDSAAIIVVPRVDVEVSS